MRLLLDTVTFLRAAASPELLSSKALEALQNDRAIREISTLSLSEIAIKQALGKLDFRKRDVLAGIADLKLRILPYTADHALELFGLPRHHNDPFDRQIIAQALAEKMPVVSCDEKFSLYAGLNVIW